MIPFQRQRMSDTPHRRPYELPPASAGCSRAPAAGNQKRHKTVNNISSSLHLYISTLSNLHRYMSDSVSSAQYSACRRRDVEASGRASGRAVAGTCTGGGVGPNTPAPWSWPPWPASVSGRPRTALTLWPPCPRAWSASRRLALSARWRRAKPQARVEHGTGEVGSEAGRELSAMVVV